MTDRNATRALEQVRNWAAVKLAGAPIGNPLESKRRLLILEAVSNALDLIEQGLVPQPIEPPRDYMGVVEKEVTEKAV
jgi:hypothetical protein